MDAVALPLTGVDELDSHLDSLCLSSPPSAAVLNPALFDDVTLQVTAASAPTLAPRFLPKVVAVLHRLPQVVAQPPREADIQQAATVLAELATKLLGPVGFADALMLATPAGLIGALGADAVAATNVLAMTVVHKAAADPATVAQLATPAMEGLLVALVTRWLAAPDVGVGEKGGRVLGDLLEVDVPRPTVNGTVNGIVNGTSPGGSGRLWQRLFHDPALYDHLLKPICQGRHPSVLDLDADDEPSPQGAADEPTRQTTLAQARVLRLVPRLAALNLPAIEDSLLPFVSLHMVVPVDRDVLMHLSVIDYFETLVGILRVGGQRQQQQQQQASPPQHTVDVLRSLLREATASDPELLQKLRTLPERTVPEEADALRAWLGQVLPSTASGTRVSGWT